MTRREVIGARKRKQGGRLYLQVAIEHEEIFAGVIHRVAAQIVDQESYIGRASLVIGARQGELVAGLMRKKHLEAATAEHKSEPGRLVSHIAIVKEEGKKTGAKTKN